jgi:hypothetical protein
MLLRGPLALTSLIASLSLSLAFSTAIAAKADPQVAMIPALATTTLSDAGPDNQLVPAPLGMRLSEFKQLSTVDHDKYPTARVLCSGDP